MASAPVRVPARMEENYYSRMRSPTSDLQAEVAAAVDEYQTHGNPLPLRARLKDIAGSAMPDALIAAVEPYRDIPDVAIPVYEQVVADQPGNARALVILANAYWLTGRGPDVVGDLASRAIAADATNRGAWHLWALSESDPRQRVARWQQVIARFPSDDLARAALADNAASLAGAEHDMEALDLAIETYEQLLSTAQSDAQRNALEGALTALRGWKL
jgi:tetratricopeptide (TPR) repeat protein